MSFDSLPLQNLRETGNRRRIFDPQNLCVALQDSLRPVTPRGPRPLSVGVVHDLAEEPMVDRTLKELHHGVAVGVRKPEFCFDEKTSCTIEVHMPVGVPHTQAIRNATTNLAQGGNGPRKIVRKPEFDLKLIDNPSRLIGQRKSPRKERHPLPDLKREGRIAIPQSLLSRGQRLRVSLKPGSWHARSRVVSVDSTRPRRQLPAGHRPSPAC